MEDPYRGPLDEIQKALSSKETVDLSGSGIGEWSTLQREERPGRPVREWRKRCQEGHFQGVCAEVWTFPAPKQLFFWKVESKFFGIPHHLECVHGSALTWMQAMRMADVTLQELWRLQRQHGPLRLPE